MCWARQPVQWPGTIMAGASSVSARTVGAMMGSKADPAKVEAADHRVQLGHAGEGHGVRTMSTMPACPQPDSTTRP